MKATLVFSVISSILMFYPVECGAQEPKPISDIQIFSYGCHFELPRPEKKMRGSWVALAYPVEYTIGMPRLNKGASAQLMPVEITFQTCGEVEQGAAYPDSPRTQILGKSDRNVQWLLRGVPLLNPQGQNIECAQWSKISQNTTGSKSRKLSGTFLGKIFDFEIVQSNASEMGPIYVFSWSGKRQVLLNTSIDDTLVSIFVGDLDGDDHPDLIFSTEDGKDCGTDYLFLSSHAKGKDLVRQSATLTECS